MFAEQRRMRMAKLVQEHESVSIADLAQSFQVSEETVRRDLSRLEQQGQLQRTRGGAITINGAVAPLEGAPLSGGVPPLGARLSRQNARKKAIASLAATLVHDGETVLLDSGTTVLELARHLETKKGLVIFTPSIAAAGELGRVSHLTVSVPGGVIQSPELTLVGPECQASLERVRADKVFVGCAGLDVEHGLSVGNSLEVEIKAQLLRSARQRVLLTDSSKLERTSLVSFAHLDEIDVIVTDDQFDRTSQEKIQQLGVKVLMAEPDEPDEREPLQSFR